MRHVIIALCLVVALGCQTVPLAPAEAPSARAQAFNHYLMGDIHRRNGRFEQAITEFVTAHEYAPDDPNLVKHIIRGYLMIHDLEKARTMRRRTITPDRHLVHAGPDLPPAGRYDEATEAFTKALDLTDFNVFIYDEPPVGEESNDLVSVVDIYTKLVQLHPDSAMLYERLGLSLAHRKRGGKGVSASPRADSN